jgi:hypothetical protein
VGVARPLSVIAGSLAGVGVVWAGAGDVVEPELGFEGAGDVVVVAGGEAGVGDGSGTGTGFKVAVELFEPLGVVPSIDERASSKLIVVLPLESTALNVSFASVKVPLAGVVS